MNKALAHTILTIGVVLLLFGLNTGHSIASEAKGAFTGNPTDKSMILLVTGIAAVVVGGSASFFRRHSDN